MDMKASEVGSWLRQIAGKRDHREVLSDDGYLVLRPGPNFDLLNPARIPQMGWLPGDIFALFIQSIQRFARQEAGSFCFHPLHPPQLSCAYWRKLLTQLRNLARSAGCLPVHLGNPGSRVITWEQDPLIQARGNCRSQTRCGLSEEDLRKDA